MDEDRTQRKYITRETDEENNRQEGNKGGETHFITWYEFESDTKDEETEEQL